jgi:hypothetical protein
MTTAEQIAAAYGLTLAQARKVAEIAGRLGVDGSWLAALVWFESKFKPAQKGPGTAYGLGQFTAIALEELGVTRAELERMGFNEQMALLYRHLTARKKEATNLIDFTMNHFYPKAFGKPDMAFPSWVTNANPGIRTPRDYVAKMVSQARLPLAEGLPKYPFVGPPLLPFEIPPMGTPKDDGWKFWFNVGGLVFFGTTLVLSAVKLSRRRV